MSFEVAKKIYDAAVLFVETVMSDEFRKRIRSQKTSMASGGISDYIPDVDMEKRLSGVLRFADVLAKVFTDAPTESSSTNTDSIDSSYKKRKKTVGK